MTYRLVIKDPATQDLRHQAEYILQQGNLEAAVRFLEAAEATFAQLATLPRMGKAIKFVSSLLGEIRQWRVLGFEDHLIFYRVSETTIEVLRVLHGARDLANLLDQLNDST